MTSISAGGSSALLSADSREDAPDSPARACLSNRRPDRQRAHRDARDRYRVEAMLATRADALKTGQLVDERAHERFPQPTSRSPRDRVGGNPPATREAESDVRPAF
jgi:hypothetical protein